MQGGSSTNSRLSACRTVCLSAAAYGTSLGLNGPAAAVGNNTAGPSATPFQRGKNERTKRSLTSSHSNLEESDRSAGPSGVSSQDTAKRSSLKRDGTLARINLV